MPALLETTDEQTTLRCEGAVDISQATELKRLLLAALERGRPVELSLSAATELDATTAQLLWAAARAAHKAGLAFTLSAPPSDEAWAILRDGGLEWSAVLETA